MFQLTNDDEPNKNEEVSNTEYTSSMPNIENSPILLNATAQRIPDAIKVSCESIFLFLKSKITGKPSVKIK